MTHRKATAKGIVNKHDQTGQMENENKQLKSKLDNIMADADFLKKNYSKGK